MKKKKKAKPNFVFPPGATAAEAALALDKIAGGFIAEKSRRPTEEAGPVSQLDVPENATAYYERGLEYIKRGDYRNAIEDFTRSLDMNPKSAVTYYNRAAAYLSAGDYDRAIADCTKSIKIDPNLACGYNNRGLAYAAKKNCSRAITDLNGR